MFRSPDDPETEVQFDQRMLEMSLGILKPQSFAQRQAEEMARDQFMKDLAFCEMPNREELERQSVGIIRLQRDLSNKHAEVMPEYDELFA